VRRDGRRANKEIEFCLHDGFSSIRVNAWSKYSQVITWGVIIPKMLVGELYRQPRLSIASFDLICPSHNRGGTDQRLERSAAENLYFFFAEKLCKESDAFPTNLSIG
jgi:hypothetical protein